MGRIPRRNLKRGIYHVYNRSANQAWILNDDDLKERFVNLLKHYAVKYPVNIYHFCVMSNHFHLAIEGDIEVISRFVSALCSQYSRFYRETMNVGRGPLWQGRYKSVIVQKEGYLSRLGRYIELNPVRAKMIDVHDLANYRWSSARYYLQGISDSIIKPIDHPFHKSLEEYGEHRKKIYADYLCVPYEEDITLFRSCVAQIGDASFLSSIVAGISGRLKLTRGRPRKTGEK